MELKFEKEKNDEYAKRGVDIFFDVGRISCQEIFGENVYMHILVGRQIKIINII